jgi:hypothetical protein
MHTFINIIDKYKSINGNTSYGTDKMSTHSYGDIYELLFKNLCTSAIDILEIGYDGGFFYNAYPNIL